MPRNLTLADAEKVARAADPKLWAKLSPAERKALVQQVNADLAEQAKAKAFIKRQLQPAKRKK
jgi:hypothetical protein